MHSDIIRHIKDPMKRIKAEEKIIDEIIDCGQDILVAADMQRGKTLPMHRNVSIFSHCVSVAYVSILIADKYHIKNLDRSSLIRGALLHDFFLYDWHIHEKWHRFHGFIHPRIALDNASKEFSLTKKEKDIILHHMFPLTLSFPRSKEAFIVDMADKICANHEHFHMETLVEINQIEAYKPRLIKAI